MIYILIVLAIGFNPKGVAIDHVEFNNLEACQAAAAEWSKQYSQLDVRRGVVFCAGKGKS